MATQMVQRRNIVVLGKTGAGKSTVANKITDHKNFTVKQSVKSVTSKTSHTEVTMTDPDTKVRYDMKLIDTVGVFDTVKPNYKVMNEIKEYFQNKVPEGVNLVLFVFRQGRFTEEENETFKYITKYFRKYNISAISALIITNCDGLDQDGRQRVVADFRSNAESTAQFMKKGIYAVGFPDTEHMKKKLRKAYEKDMKDDAKILRKLAMEAGEMRLGKEMFEPSFWETLGQCVIL